MMSTFGEGGVALQARKLAVGIDSGHFAFVIMQSLVSGVGSVATARVRATITLGTDTSIAADLVQSDLERNWVVTAARTRL